jgi:hypothetical protein
LIANQPSYCEINQISSSDSHDFKVNPESCVPEAKQSGFGFKPVQFEYHSIQDMGIGWGLLFI